MLHARFRRREPARALCAMAPFSKGRRTRGRPDNKSHSMGRLLLHLRPRSLAARTKIIFKASSGVNKWIAAPLAPDAGNGLAIRSNVLISYLDSRRSDMICNGSGMLGPGAGGSFSHGRYIIPNLPRR
jgi:hypothetical protein